MTNEIIPADNSEQLPESVRLGAFEGIIKNASARWNHLKCGFCEGRKRAGEQEEIIGRVLKETAQAGYFGYPCHNWLPTGAGLFDFSGALHTLKEEADIDIRDDGKVSLTAPLLSRIAAKLAQELKLGSPAGPSCGVQPRLSTAPAQEWRQEQCEVGSEPGSGPLP
jgi:hypothetical protein